MLMWVIEIFEIPHITNAENQLNGNCEACYAVSQLAPAKS